MFQYTREIIINDQAFEQRGTGETAELFIPHVGSYKKEYVKSVLTAPAVDAVMASLTLAKPTLAGSPDVMRITVKLKMQTGDVHALLANYTTLFSRGIIVELPAAATLADIQNAFAESMRGMEEWPVSLSADKTKIVADTPYLTLEMHSEGLKYRANSISEMVVVSTGTPVIATGTRPFGTYETLVKDNRLPTLENVRPWGQHQEEYPQKGAKYDLVEIKYVADRNIGGFDVLGQTASSVTTHRFWVRSDKSSAFVAILDAVTAEPEPPVIP